MFLAYLGTMTHGESGHIQDSRTGIKPVTSALQCPTLTRQKFSVPFDRDQVAQVWGRRGYTCDVFTDPPGREWNDFVHMTNELVTVCGGETQTDYRCRRNSRSAW